MKGTGAAYALHHAVPGKGRMAAGQLLPSERQQPTGNRKGAAGSRNRSNRARQQQGTAGQKSAGNIQRQAAGKQPTGAGQKRTEAKKKPAMARPKSTGARRKQQARHSDKKNPQHKGLKSSPRRSKSGTNIIVLPRRRRTGKSAAEGTPSFPLSIWSKRAYRAGVLDGQEAMAIGLENWKQTMNELWNRWLARRLANIPLADEHYAAISAQYARGFSDSAGVKGDRVVLLPTTRKVAAVVTVMNEERTLSEVLEQLERLPLSETIVVINGSTDNSYHIARSRPELTVLNYPEPLGHDVGRAIGAKTSSSDIVLFMDGDFPVDAEQLLPFIAEIARGKDVALNDIHRYIGVFSQRDVVTVMKEFLNRVLGREDLGASSLTAIPHALSREAIEKIGYESLAVPPLAHAKAVRFGLVIGNPISVDVITKNKVRRNWNVGVSNPVAEMIIGDHIEALHYCMSAAGSRLSFPDQTRNRQSIAGVTGDR